MQLVADMLKQSDELKDRIEARKHELLSKYNELKADTRHEANERATQIKAKLDELTTHLETGWDNMTDAVRAKLNKWLDKDRSRE